MKRTLLTVSLCLLVSGFAFAQKGKVKDAKSAMNSEKYDEARGYIKDALSNPETMNDPETWKTAGDIEYTAFDKELDKEKIKQIKGDGANMDVMYSGLYNMYEPYIKADELGQLPDPKGKVKNKVRKNIIKNLKSGFTWFINGGVHYTEKQEYAKAADFFERYWEMPSLEMLKEEGETLETLGVADSTFHSIKYYAIISVLQAKDHPRAIKLLNKIIEEGYVQNSTYKESDPYEFLAGEYQATEDSVAYVNALKLGANKFPGNPFFTPNLINAYIRANKTQEAIDYLNQAIVNDPSNACDFYSVKASLYAEKKEYTEAEGVYIEALSADPNCAKALEGRGIIHILKAQDIKDQAGQITNRKEQTEMDKKAIAEYELAYPFLEKLKETLKSKGADKEDIRQASMKLHNIYYNLVLLQVDKNAEVNELAKELGYDVEE